MLCKDTGFLYILAIFLKTSCDYLMQNGFFDDIKHTLLKNSMRACLPNYFGEPYLKMLYYLIPSFSICLLRGGLRSRIDLLALIDTIVHF